jgi:DNA-binding Lrp family transcriptional regulator
MPKAYVLINCQIGTQEKILNQLKKVLGVAEISEVNGVYDIVVKVYSSTLGSLKQTITQ